MPHQGSLEEFFVVLRNLAWVCEGVWIRCRAVPALLLQRLDLPPLPRLYESEPHNTVSPLLPLPLTPPQAHTPKHNTLADRPIHIHTYRLHTMAAASTGAFGMMDPAYFVGRIELLKWLNSFLSLQYSKIEEVCSGTLGPPIAQLSLSLSLSLSRVATSMVSCCGRE